MNRPSPEDAGRVREIGEQAFTDYQAGCNALAQPDLPYTDALALQQHKSAREIAYARLQGKPIRWLEPAAEEVQT